MALVLPKIFAAEADNSRWGKRMSNHIASALLVYTLLQIFVVMGSMAHQGMSLLPYFGLVLLVMLIIPYCRKFEKRWVRLSGSELSPNDLAVKYKIDVLKLWVAAIGLPFIFVGIYKVLSSLF